MAHLKSGRDSPCSPSLPPLSPLPHLLFHVLGLVRVLQLVQRLLHALSTQLGLLLCTLQPQCLLVIQPARLQRRGEGGGGQVRSSREGLSG